MYLHSLSFNYFDKSKDNKGFNVNNPKIIKPIYFIDGITMNQNDIRISFEVEPDNYLYGCS